MEIEHAQVGTALQMIHRETLECGPGFQPGLRGDSGLEAQATFLRAGDEEAALFYVPRFTPALVPALRQAVKETAAAIPYSGQPETLRQHIRANHVQHEAIPESLARRFGMKG